MRKTTNSVYRKIRKWHFSLMALCALFTCLPALSQTTGTVSIGSGTTTGTALPVYTYYYYTYSQQIVPAATFSAGGGAAGQITGIRYYSQTAEIPLANWENWTVYIGHTTKNTFTSTSNWEPVANLTQVFSGTVTPVAGGWMEIVFNTPFTYDGTSNLIVAVDENSPGYSDSFTSSYWGAYAGGANTGIYYSSDTTNPDPNGTLPNGTRTGTLARLQFVATLASCLPPSAVHAVTVTNNSASLEWTAPVVAPSDGYQYYVSTTNTAPLATTAGTDTPTASATAGSLTPNTPYYVWVRSKCGTTFSAWVAGTSFTTACNPVAGALTQEFSTGLVPSCWTTTSSNPVANGLWKFAGTADYAVGNTRAAGTFAWVDGSDPSTIADVTLYTPFIDLTGITLPEVVFDYYSNSGSTTYPNNIFKVEVLNGTTWTNIYEDNTSEAGWRTITVPLTGLGNQTIRLRFVVDKTAAPVGWAFYNDIALDNVKVRQQPSCIVPTDLEVLPDTPTTLSAAWLQASPAPASGYQYYYSTTNTTPAADVTGTHDVPTGNSTTITNLTPATTYYVWVRSNCGSGSYSEWTPAVSAVTLCDAANVPYTENFEAVTTPALPVCTTVVNEGLGNSWITATPAVGGFNSKALRYNYTYAGPGDTWFFTRAVNLTAGTSYRIAYRYGASSTTYVEKLAVGYGTIAESAAMEPLADHPSVTGTTPTNGFVDFIPTTTGVYYFGFHAYSALGQNYLYVDDISVDLSPTCLAPTALTVTGTTDSTVSLEWEASTSNPSQGYQYYYSTTNTAPTAGTPGTGTVAAGATSTTVTGLTANTTYYIWLRAHCTGDDLSAWTQAVQFTTPCVPVAAPVLEEFSTGVIPSCWSTTSSNPVANGLWKFAGNPDYDPGNTRTPGTFAWADGSDPSNISDVTLLSPMINLTGITNPEVVFDYFSNSGNTEYPNNTFTVDVYDGTTWETIYTDNTNDENWRTIALPLSDYANSTIRLRFVVDKTAAPAGFAFYNDIALDNVKVRQVPSCIVPTDLEAAEDSTSEISLVWVAPATAPSNGYQYYYSTTNATPAADVTGTVDVPTGTSTTITGLTSATTYYIWLRSNCGNGSYSEWTPVVFATTLCDAANVPYTENFESVTTPALPTCTEVINEGLGNAWITSTPAAGGFTSKALRYNYSYAGPGDTWFFTRGVNLTAGTSYRIAYRYGASSTFYTESLAVGYGTIAESAAMEPLADHPTVSGTTPTSTYVDFTPATTGVYYFGFQAYSPLGQNYLYVDDINVDVTPSCIPPVNVTAEATGLNTATVEWEAPAVIPADGYQYYYSTSNTAPTGTTNPSGSVNAGLLTQNLTGLTSGTVYHVWVRANCGNGDVSAWSASATFTTDCDFVNVPYVEDFESVTTPALPACTVVINNGDGNSWFTSTPALGGFNSKALRYNYTYAGDADTWFFTRGMNLTAGTEYTLTYRYGASSTTYVESLAVGFGTAADADSMEPLADHPSVTGTTPSTNSVQFTPATTGVYYIGFQAYSELGENYLYLDDIKVDVTASTGGFDLASFRHYPNPVKDVLNIAHTADITSVEVYNLLGQQVLAKKVNATETAVDMSALADGAYMVNVTAGNSVKTIKVVKKQ